MAEGASKYWAFISYSHTDERWGRWLHRAIEHYRVPRGLVGRPGRTDDGPLPRRLFPVFRDREELPISASLSDNIDGALKRSRYLVVVCSPRSAVSRWVEQEVRDYKKTGRADRVLAFIVEGEPNASDHPDSGLLECFPRALRHIISPTGELLSDRVEPIAADVRPGKDGKSNARLKLLAGILGVSFDDLRQRERRRRFWRRVGTAAMGLTIAASLAGVWWFEHTQALAAERSRYLRLSDLMVEKVRTAQRLDQENGALLYGAHAIEYGILSGMLTPADPERQPAEARKLDLLGSLTLSARPAVSPPETQFARLLAVAPNGHLLAWARKDGGIVIWDGRAAPRSIGTVSGPRTLAFNGDGSLLVASDEDGAVHRWNLASGAAATAASAHGKQLRALALAPDGVLAAAGEGPGIELWNGAGIRRPDLRLEGADRIADANALAFSPDGKTLAAVTRNLSLYLLDPDTGHDAQPPYRYRAWPRALAFSPDGSLLAVGLWDGTVRLWDVAAWREVARLKTQERSVEAVAFSRDGKFIASGSRQCELWEVSSRSRVATLAGQTKPVIAVAFAAADGGGERIICGSEDGTIRLWQLARPLFRDAVADHAGSVFTVAFHPIENIVATAGETHGSGSDYAEGETGAIRLWDYTTSLVESQPRLPAVHTDDVRALAFSRDGRWLASAGNDGQIVLWDWRTRSPVAGPTAEPKHHSWIYRLAFSPDGKMLASAGYPFTGLTLGVGGTDNVVRLWSVPELRFLGEFTKHKGSVGSVVFSPDGSLLASSSDDKLIRFWDPTQPDAPGRPATRLAKLEGHRELARPIAFSPDGKLLASGGGDAAIKLWDVAACRSTRRCSPIAGLVGHHAYMIWALAFSPDGSLLASGSQSDDRQTIRLWDVAHRKLVAFLTGHRGFALSLAFSPDGTLLASGGSDGTLRLWRVADFWPPPVGGAAAADTPLLPFLAAPPYDEGHATELINSVSRLTGLQLEGTDARPAGASVPSP